MVRSEMADDVEMARHSLALITASVEGMARAESQAGATLPREVLASVMECASCEMAIIEANALVGRVKTVRVWE
jgi:hypothetical protein